jgi:hypothetical protein
MVVCFAWVVVVPGLLLLFYLLPVIEKATTVVGRRVIFSLASRQICFFGLLALFVLSRVVRLK